MRVADAKYTNAMNPKLEFIEWVRSLRKPMV